MFRSLPSGMVLGIIACLLAAAPPAHAAKTPLATFELVAGKGFEGGHGQFRVFVDPDASTRRVFTIKAAGLPKTREGRAYGVWLTGGAHDHFLGFGPSGDGDGRFAASGPRAPDRKRLRHWLHRARHLLVTVETHENAASPGRTVLRGSIEDL